jgi:hypothetical protein
MGCTLCKLCKQSCRTIKRRSTYLKRLRKTKKEENVEMKTVSSASGSSSTIGNIYDDDLPVEPFTDITVHIEDSNVNQSNSEFEFVMVNYKGNDGK